MDIGKLKEALAKNGVDKETAKKVLADLEEKPNEEEHKDDEPQAEGKTEEEVPPANPDEEKGEGEPNDKEGEGNEGEGKTPQEEVPVPPAAEEVPPADLPPVDAPVPPVEETPAPAPEVPPVPPFDPTELLGKIEEQSKTIEGLLTRIESLEQALANAGVLDKSDEGKEIGLDGQVIPNSGSNGATDEFDEALALLNHKR